MLKYRRAIPPELINQQRCWALPTYICCDVDGIDALHLHPCCQLSQLSWVLDVVEAVLRKELLQRILQHGGSCLWYWGLAGAASSQQTSWSNNLYDFYEMSNALNPINEKPTPSKKVQRLQKAWGNWLDFCSSPGVLPPIFTRPGISFQFLERCSGNWRFPKEDRHLCGWAEQSGTREPPLHSRRSRRKIAFEM